MATRVARTEAVLLTGGRSARMGLDKTTLLVRGVPLAVFVARALAERCARVTVLGREPVAGFPFIGDRDVYGGPLMALAGFLPTAERVFVASGDLPRFDPVLVDCLGAALTESDTGEATAAVASVAGALQPMCALYDAGCWSTIPRVVSSGRRSMMAWLETLGVSPVDEALMRTFGLNPLASLGVNTPQEWQAFQDGA